MIDKTSPEWQAFYVKCLDYLNRDRITHSQWMEMRFVQSINSGDEILESHAREWSEYKLLRDMWASERASKRRWLTVVGFMALAFCAIVGMMYLAWNP